MREVRARLLPTFATLVVALVSASGTAALAGACTSDFDVTPEADGGDGDGSSTDRATCPKVPPVNAAPCTLPEGTTCTFGPCTGVATCSRGIWRFGSNPSPVPLCPDPEPNAGTECPRCWPVEKTCPYGSDDCSLPDASTSRTLASCPAVGGADKRVWVVDIKPCKDGGLDADGADVQGDGEAGAD